MLQVQTVQARRRDPLEKRYGAAKEIQGEDQGDQEGGGQHEQLDHVAEHDGAHAAEQVVDQGDGRKEGHGGAEGQVQANHEH